MAHDSTQDQTSPYRLIQETLDRADPVAHGWRVLVVCVLLNRTHGEQARAVVDALFTRWPTPTSLAIADEAELRALIKPCGLQGQRASSLRRMSGAYQALVLRGVAGVAVGSRPSRAEVSRLPGVGPYALDAWAIFVDDMLPPDEPRDHKLAAYWRWRMGLVPRGKPQARDVALAFLAGGAVQAKALAPTANVVRKAAGVLREMKRGDAADKLLEALAWAANERGPAAAKVGDERVVVVSARRKTPAVRIPVGSFGVKPGDALRFKVISADEIRVLRLP